MCLGSRRPFVFAQIGGYPCMCVSVCAQQVPVWLVLAAVLPCFLLRAFIKTCLDSLFNAERCFCTPAPLNFLVSEVWPLKHHRRRNKSRFVVIIFIITVNPHLMSTAALQHQPCTALISQFFPLKLRYLSSRFELSLLPSSLVSHFVSLAVHRSSVFCITVSLPNAPSFS